MCLLLSRMKWWGWSKLFTDQSGLEIALVAANTVILMM